MVVRRVADETTTQRGVLKSKAEKKALTVRRH
jgi:hypothetical protein